MDDTEAQIRAAWASGQEARLSPGLPGGRPDEDSPLPAVEATLLLRLLAEGGGHPRGLRLQGARIVGEWDWSWQTLDVPIRFRQCVIAEHIDLTYSTLPGLELLHCRAETLGLSDANIAHDLILDGSTLAGMRADGAHVGSDVLLRDGFTCTGEILASSAAVGGEFDVRRATLSNRGGCVIDADGITVGGNMYFLEGCESRGELRLVGAKIGGQLVFEGAKLANRGRTALAADSAEIGNAVFFVEGCEIIGETRLLGASIAGQLGISGSKFSDPDGYALSADGIKVTGDAFVIDGCHLRGETGFAGAILHEIQFAGSTFENPDGVALDLRNAHVSEVLQLGGLERRPTGTIDLSGASVGELSDDAESWPVRGNLILAGFSYTRLGSEAPTDVEARLAWLRRAPAYSPQPYRQLARVMTESGLPDHARRIQIAARDDERLLGDLGWYQRAANRFLGVTIAHGYRPLRPAWLILAGVLLTWWIVASNTAVFVPTGDNVPENARTGKPSISASRCTTEYPCLIPAAYALENMTPILDLHQASLWQPTTATPAGRGVRAWLYATSIVGWIGSTLIVVALTGLAERRE
ncbi:hypothetical protein [Cryptosporangium phraense]|uniref:Oxidoreductase n=1 Tax=Cryptosporangium phraense TaxID=2593070 RepID=A0A545AT44_9ACTN|nr:hypothetical protein [Cryptosporangium phraense]TQS44510.1 hypothetical protein FL583_13695 [Cryptosporangium phraense]